MNDQLLTHLLELQAKLVQHEISVILGGGMSLYIRHSYVRPQPSPRYPFEITSRSTNDLDLFLSSKLIVDAEKVGTLKDTLKDSDYRINPKAKNFQFIKDVKLGGQDRVIKIDLLAAPPEKADLKKVKISKPRIRPSTISGIHAYLTEEAEGIDIGKVEVSIQSQTIYIPSSYNSIILKMHAFNDRKNKDDEQSDFGRHHVYDIFATITRMNEADWQSARQHFQAHQTRDYLKKTITIQESCFANPSDIGLIRLQENTAFKQEKEVYAKYLEMFIEDLKDLFSE